MKLAVLFDFDEGVTVERATNLALGIATMVNASVRGELDVKVNINPSTKDLSTAQGLGVAMDYFWDGSTQEKK